MCRCGSTVASANQELGGRCDTDTGAKRPGTCARPCASEELEIGYNALLIGTLYHIICTEWTELELRMKLTLCEYEYIKVLALREHIALHAGPSHPGVCSVLYIYKNGRTAMPARVPRYSCYRSTYDQTRGVARMHLLPSGRHSQRKIYAA